MHDLLEKMGKDIIEQESPTEPGGRSRLWFHEDVKHVLTKNTGTNKITGIMLDFPKQDDEIFLDVGRSFSKMKNLKIFINYNVCLSGYASSIPSNLRVLDWYRCPFESFPANFRPKALVVLNLPYSRIKQIVKRLQHFTKLTFLNLTGSEFLTEIPDLSGSPNLRSLDARGCRSLVKVDASVGYLHKLEQLYLSGTAIKELPSSIGRLTALEQLYLEECENLTNLPPSIYGFQNLQILNLNRCPKLVTLPNNLIYEESLPLEVLTNSNIPRDNFSSLAVPKQCIIQFQECNVSDIDSLENFGWSSEVWMIDLSNSYFVSLPVRISKFVNLEILFLHGCKRLVEIEVQLPPSIKFVDVTGCVSLERFSTLSKILEDGDMQGISHMYLCCHKLCNNLGLDAAKMANILLNQPVKRHNVITVTLPGSKVPERFSFPDRDVSVSFSFCTDVGVLPLNSYSNHEHKFEIPWTFGLENTKLVLCTVWEITESFVGSRTIELSFFIDGVCIGKGRNVWVVSEGETGARHVWLQYVQLPAHTKPKGDDDGKSDDQLKPSISRIITVSCTGGEGLLFKSFGVHLAHISMPKDGDDGKNDENEENEDEDEYEYESDNNVGDEVRPRKRKKMTSLCISIWIFLMMGVVVLMLMDINPPQSTADSNTMIG